MEYWVDVEIVQLMQKFKFQQEINKEESSTSSSHHNYLDDDFVREKVLKIMIQILKWNLTQDIVQTLMYFAK